MHGGIVLLYNCAGGKSADELWREHIRDRDGLHAYSVAMQRLATGSWAGREDGGRISWCVEASGGYFSRHLEHLLLKDLRRLGHGMPTLVPPSLLPASAEAVTETVSALHGRAWRLLDVGSCYNPFQAWPQFVVTAIDIAPATEVQLAELRLSFYLHRLSAGTAMPGRLCFIID